MPDEGDGKRYEIVGGVRFMTPSPFERHQRASRNLEYLLMQYLEDRDLGEVYDAPIDVVLSDDTVLVPDIVFVSKARVSIIEQRGLFAAPDLVVEILSEGTKRRDRGIKLRAYAEHGVREYWLLDPVRRTRRDLRARRPGSGEVLRARLGQRLVADRAAGVLGDARPDLRNSAGRVSGV